MTRVKAATDLHSWRRSDHSFADQQAGSEQGWSFLVISRTGSHCTLYQVIVIASAMKSGRAQAVCVSGKAYAQSCRALQRLRAWFHVSAYGHTCRAACAVHVAFVGQGAGGAMLASSAVRVSAVVRATDLTFDLSGGGCSSSRLDLATVARKACCLCSRSARIQTLQT